jgi:DNA-binding NarL/FixJ family response regulator
MLTRLLLVDDHPLFRQGLGALISTAPDLEIIGEAGNSDDVRALANQREIDVAVVDLVIPTISGIGVTRELHDLLPSCRVLGLSVVAEPSVIAEMLRAGAVGFALKTEPPMQILQAIRDAAAGTRYLPQRLSREAIERELAGAGRYRACLTKRECEIFELMIRGYTNTEIGTRLFIARRTVETHRYRITKKLNARSIVELQRVAALYER